LAELGQVQVFATFFIALIINSSLLVGIKWKYALGNYHEIITHRLKFHIYSFHYFFFTYIPSLDIILLTFNLSITALAVYFAFNSSDILKTMDYSVTVKSKLSLQTHSMEEDDDDGLKFTSLEDTDYPELMYITADSHERLINDLDDYDFSSQRRDIFDFDLQDSPDPYIIVDDNDDDKDGNDVHRKQTTQEDYLDSDYSLSSRFNTPYNVQK